MSNPTFDARDLWRSQVPYHEPDEVVALGPVRRKVLFAGLWRAGSALNLVGFTLPTVGSLRGASSLNVNGSVA